MIFNITLWSKIKNLRWQFWRIFRWLRRGVLHFFCFHGEICKTKWMQNGCYSQYNQKCPFCFANFSMKTRSTEKMKYTTTKPTENPSKLSSQIFNFWNFVTEIFCHKVMLKLIIPPIENCTDFLIKSWFLTLVCDEKKKWDDSFKGFSVGFVVVYSIFSVDHVFLVKFAKQNGHFLLIWE